LIQNQVFLAARSISLWRKVVTNKLLFPCFLKEWKYGQYKCRRFQ